MRSHRYALALGAFLSLLHCTLPANTLPTRCQAIEVDASRELLVTDVALLVSEVVSQATVSRSRLGVRTLSFTFHCSNARHSGLVVYDAGGKQLSVNSQ